MSLIPSLQHDLRLPRLRTQNRRSKHTSYQRGRVAEVFFIVTRADLLAPKKEQVDALLPYIRELLRDALGKESKNLRLGNVKCVSAKRGWWTKPVKEAVWSRGGAGWMVGKVNVGKSSLFEVVFPKGRSVSTPLLTDTSLATLERAQHQDALSHLAAPTTPPPETDDDDAEIVLASESSLLPALQPESPYPVMPITSSLPGTTASPIRVPFGAGKGELIDLPGVARSTLADHVLASSQNDLLMSSRVSPDQIVLKPGQSLLIGGGLIRITNPDPKEVLLVYPFVPLSCHVTSTQKSLSLEKGDMQLDIPSIVRPESRDKMARAGSFEVKWDVTKARAGPLTRRDAVGIRADRLPFVVWGCDLVVEGVGWVEIAGQRRRKEFERAMGTGGRKGGGRGGDGRGRGGEEDPFPETMAEGAGLHTGDVSAEKTSPYPLIDVFSPDGQYVMVRRPMGAWLLGQKMTKKTPAGARQRRSMRSVKMSDQGRARIKAQEDA
ncbi:Arginyl-tRNA--protein transferase 1 isoform B [Sphaceloma murrayae]|uniref:Arginyl-tRNA--protein transferase 1 isoform B n=1 Tax=Sphaceloma murrayae TaxID=2082308 RepID=A0A2K1QPS7_9PEZI|nr:Arginyl-tRNA--protein transferase 1 isoform B [Sphaceloma murrayae]